MQRLIKFRAWDKEKGIWVSSGEIEFSISEGSVTVVPNTIEHIGDSIHDMYVSDRFVVTEYTGLKDRNGVEIYEGDILNAGSDVVVVEWHKSKATFCLQKDGWLYAHFFEEAIDADQCEVIGNIYESPELLNEK